MKFLSYSSLLAASGLAIASLVGFAGNAQAQLTGTTPITVTVSGVLEIVSTPAALTYDETDAPTSSTGVGNVNLRSNQKDGFNIKVSSDNGGLLESTDVDNTATIGYTISGIDGTGGSGLNLTSSNGAFTTGVTPDDTAPGNAIFTSNAFSNTKCVSAAGCNLGIALTISSTDLLDAPADTYTDTVTYTIAAN